MNLHDREAYVLSAGQFDFNRHTAAMQLYGNRPLPARVEQASWLFRILFQLIPAHELSGGASAWHDAMRERAYVIRRIYYGWSFALRPVSASTMPIPLKRALAEAVGGAQRTVDSSRRVFVEEKGEEKEEAGQEDLVAVDTSGDGSRQQMINARRKDHEVMQLLNDSFELETLTANAEGDLVRVSPVKRVVDKVGHGKFSDLSPELVMMGEHAPGIRCPHQHVRAMAV
jgi:hypothetical protein